MNADDAADAAGSMRNFSAEKFRTTAGNEWGDAVSEPSRRLRLAARPDTRIRVRPALTSGRLKRRYSSSKDVNFDWNLDGDLSLPNAPRHISLDSNPVTLTFRLRLGSAGFGIGASGFDCDNKLINWYWEPPYALLSAIQSFKQTGDCDWQDAPSLEFLLGNGNWYKIRLI